VTAEKQIYLLEAATGEIKIGCSADPVARWKAISAASPCFINLIAMWPGSFADEHSLHKRFADLRVYREWFRNESGLASFVEAKRGVGAPTMPDEIRFCGLPNEERRAAQSKKHSQKIKAIWSDPDRRALMMRWR
jgi:hypothetical protein